MRPVKHIFGDVAMLHSLSSGAKGAVCGADGIRSMHLPVPAERACPARQGEEVGDAFFGALERVRAIHANCRALLRTHHQRAGLELMDAMSGYQETAYERLCRCAAGGHFRPVPFCKCCKVNIHSLCHVCTSAL